MGVVHQLLRRRHGRAEHDAPLRPRRRCGALVERERCNSIMVVGDAMARPLAEALADAGRRLRHVVGDRRRLGRRDPLPRREGAAARAACRNAMVIDSFGASETGAGGTVYDTQGPAAGPRFTMGPIMTVLDDDLRPVEPGSGVVGPPGPAAATSRSATTRTRRRRRRRSSSTRTASAGWCPATSPASRRTAPSPCSAAARVCINTGGEKMYPEEVEAALKSHPDVFDAVVVGVPDERFGERVAAIVQPRPAASPALDALQEHCRTQLAGYKVPRQLVAARRDRAHTGRQARLPVGEADRDRTRGELNGRCTGVLDDRAGGARQARRRRSRTSASCSRASCSARRTRSCTGCAPSGCSGATRSRSCCRTASR